jgi:hypothetical protein
LITLGNVELRRVKPTKTEKRSNTGMQKVVEYALWERGLDMGRASRQAKLQDKGVVLRDGTPMPLRFKEGTRAVPEFGQPVSNRVARTAAKGTEQARVKLEALNNTV